MRRVDEVILYVSDLETSIVFYRDVLGLELKFSEHGYAEFVTEGAKFGLYERSELPELIGREATPGGPAGEILFVVDDVEDWAERLAAQGITTLSGPTDRSWGQRTLHLEDPDGFVIELAQDIPRTRPRGE